MNPAEIIAPQPSPTYRPGATSMHTLAAKLHELRGEHGWLKYGSRLQAFNGRESEIDRFQESLDELVYQLQALIERRTLDAGVAYLDRCIAEHESDEQPIRPSLMRLYFDEAFGERALKDRTERIAADLVAQAGAHQEDQPDG